MRQSANCYGAIHNPPYARKITSNHSANTSLFRRCAFLPVGASLFLVVLLFSSHVSAKCLTPPGDLDASGVTNVADVQCGILMSLWELGGQVTPVPICLKQQVVDADLNCDGFTNVADVVISIFLALKQPLSADLDADGDGCADICAFDTDGDGEPNLTDCAPFDASIYPGAPESCNGLDDDCDGLKDEEVGTNAIKCTNNDVCDGVESCGDFTPTVTLVITEIMINPGALSSSDDGLREFIEIYNGGSTATDLRNWTIKDLAGQTHKITSNSPLLVRPGGYVVLGRDTDLLLNGSIYLDYVYTGITFANDADSLLLLNPADVEVDRVVYSAAGGWTIPTGASIGLTDPSINNNLAASWVAATSSWQPEVPPSADPPTPGTPASDFGTPGGPTTPFPSLCLFEPSLNCDDNNLCTDDSCHPITGCVHVDNTPACDDGNVCTDNSCSPLLGCVYTNNIAPCSDGSGCTVADVCAAGLCVSGAPPDCSDGLACTTDTCTSTGDTTFSCGSTLDSGFCLIGGVCYGDTDGNPSNQCQVCDSVADPNDWTNRIDGFSCNADSSGCTVNDSCLAGTCTAGPAPNCDDSLTCTADSCSSTGNDSYSCVNTLEPGNCLISGICYSDNDENPGNQCQLCDSATESTDWSNKTNNTPCNADSDGCTVDDACVTGVCTAGAAPDCSDGLACTTDTCTSTGDTTYSCGSTLDSGFCLIGGVCYGDTDGNPSNQCQVCDSVADSNDWTNRIDGFSCNADSSGCTVNDSCLAGVCTAGPAPNCDDSLTCTADSCSSTGNDSYSCVNTLEPGNCLISGICYSDNDENPGNQCQLCDSATESTDWSNKTTSTPCNADSDGCTVDDVCVTGVCTAGAAPDCSDGLACTTDTCTSTGDTTYSCGSTLDSGFCLIGGVCYGDTDGNPSNQCQVCDSVADPNDWTNRIDGFSCNADSSGCTVNDSCLAGVCTAGPAPNCDDSLSCTADSCSSTGNDSYSCVNTLTPGNCLISGVCYSDNDENPGNQCQLCDSATEPVDWSNKTNNTPCNADSDGCTVDDVCVTGVCTAGAAPDCSDGSACTTDTCTSTGVDSYICESTLVGSTCLIDGVCYADGNANPVNQCQVCDAGADPSDWTNRIDGFSCNADSDGCTVNDSCLAGICTAGPAPNCNDGLTCTADSCSSTGDDSYSCVNALDPGNCLISGVCYSDNTQNPGNQCQLCDSATESTDWTNKTDNTPCNADSDGCTVDDVCTTGVCTAGAAPDCSDSIVCTTDACTSTGNNAYTCGSTLDSGFCLIGGVCYSDTDGNPANQCQVCDAGADPSDWTNRIDGFSCNADSDGCTVNDSCLSGVCTAGPAPNCDDSLTCTADSCSSTGDDSYSCVNALDSGNCLISGVCYSDSDENPGNQCQLCDSATESTDWTNKTDNTPCNADSDGCTVDDVCTTGVCTAGAAPDCSDSIICTTDACTSTGNNAYTCGSTLDSGFCLIGGVCYSDTDGNPANQCQVCDAGADPSDWTNRIDGFSCNADSDGCTVNDSCLAGVCTAGPAPNCDDSLTCTTDDCSSTGDDSYSCVNELAPGNCLISGVCYSDSDENPGNQCQLCDSATESADWTNKTDNTSCNADNTVCTVDDTCQSGICVAGTPLVCDDLDVCTDDSCDPIAGCQYTPNTASCDDGNACTTTDACDTGACVPGPALDCNDNNVCTDDLCDPGIGCVYSNNTSACDDDDACTTTDLCDTGVCVSGPALDCNDNNVCTDDSCNPSVGCEYADNTAACDDDDVCTTIDVCAAGSCTGTTPLDCDDANVCTDDGCDPLGGCVYADNISPCDDADLCTLNDVCAGGTCAGTPVTCPDTGNVCVTDVCNPLFGTCGVSVANGTVCDDSDICTFSDVCSFGTCIGSPDPTCIVTGGGTLCGMAGIAGSTVICDIRVARSALSEPNATGLQFTLTYPKDIATLESFVDEACFPGFGCFDYDVPAGSPLLATGHSVTLAPQDPSGWDGEGEVVLLHLSTPTAFNDAYQNNGPFSPIVNDPVVLSARFTLQQTITALTPAEVVSSNIVATEQTATPLSSHVEDGVIITTSYKVVCSPNGSICDDGTNCTGLGICSVGVCVTGNVPNGSLCDDGDLCTDNDSCINGVCVGVSDCNDNNPCTADVCLGGGLCDYIELTGSCNDGNPCTTDDVCTAGVCVGDETTCPATTNPCVLADCNTLTGLCGVPLADGTSCDDANPCTTDDTCGNGLCSGTPDPSCVPTGSGVVCEVSGIAGALVTCHIRMARSAWSEVEATGLQLQLTYPSPTLTLTTFMDEACIVGFGCIQYMIPDGSTQLFTGHTVVLAPLELVDWSGGGSLVALNFANPSPLTDAWADAGPGTPVTGETISFSYQFLVNQYVDPANPIEIYASGISATDASAKPLRIQVYDDILLTSSYTTPCAPNGTLCDDGNPCTSFGICAQGVCAAADLPQGTACDDGDACTDNDQCSYGTCSGTPIGGCP